MNSDGNTHGEVSGIATMSDGTEVSMQLLQDVYAKVTGKKEKVSKTISTNHITSFEDLENLHAKMRQICDQYNVVQRNESVIIYHCDDSKEQFSSFVRFKAYNKSSTSPVENIHLEYNFLIMLPQTQEPQSYKISIDVHSRAALFKKAATQNRMNALIFRIVASQSGQISISYVDYNVSLNFMIAIDQWFQGLKQNPEAKVVSYLKKYSHNFSFFLRYFSVSMFLAVNYYNLSKIMQVNVSDILRSSIFIFGVAYVLGGLAARLGKWVEESIDSIFPISYVQLNRGDEKIAREITTDNRSGIIKASVGILIAVAINVFSSYLAAKIGLVDGIN
ncbi:hypothetical protein G6M04_13780 [Agrobacterium rhizogenes]|uniref:hypothetical protein n=1 Tax=Rhizobium rhizogenes TaxID=359 RepID=UPI0015748979|nr:hypothetical protein [Rhizobium rhizogenes]NTG48457.1 hypothetical protein [Rhizobium rhizogenes]